MGQNNGLEHPSPHCRVAADRGRTMATADRMPPIAAEKMTADQKKAAEEFAAGRGYSARGPFAVMLRSPEVMLRAKAMGDYLRFRNVLPKRVSEMVILITAREWTQQYEWSYHYGFALEAGLAKPIIEAMAAGRTAWPRTRAPPTTSRWSCIAPAG